eukprot:maker-scaffold317_size209118-snap-gene-1.25 protein:Tk01604 transcript:maker-scaffold317_size209118-snap-gene-1.25-mRNA-1 annotation:"cuticle protein"
MQVFITFAILAVASAAPMADKPAPYQPAPYKPASYKEPAYEEPAKYEYQYAVADDYAQTNFAQNEARDGYATNGGYRVNLPDGRTQIVTYTVQDGASGYVADVFITLAVLAAVASAAPMADNPAPYQPAPYQPAPYKPASYKEPAYEEPAKYEYQYGVQDQYAGLDFAQNEARDGYATNGEYRVLLPDGRTQIVTYTVQDGYSGYVADVFITLAVLAAVASAAPMADNPAPYQPAPYQPAPYKPASYKEPAYEEPAKYEYQYGVQDQYAGLDFAQNEARDGYATNGEYRVLLPDGRTQIVTYTVQDGYSGYVADVRYEGEAKYAPYEPKAAYKPAPKYTPAPAYKPAPAYEA